MDGANRVGTPILLIVSDPLRLRICLDASSVYGIRQLHGKTTVPGQLLPLGGVVRVYVPDAGTITAKSAEEGIFVQAGDKVVLRYQTYPYQKFGHAQGRVTFVARTAPDRLELAGLGNVFGEAAQLNEPVYLVRVQPGKQTVRAYGKELPLQAGMVPEADILHENRKIYEWVLEPLYSVAGKIGG